MAAADDLLFGLIALQNGLIDQEGLVAAFRAWTRDRAKPLADHLNALGHLDTEGRAFGLVFWRFFLAEGEVETPHAEVVPFATVATSG